MKHRKELHGSATKKQLKVIEQTNSTCNLCSKVFATQKYLMKTHQPKDPKSKLSCNVCDKTFARSFTLSRHLEPVHSTRISTEKNIFLLKKN